MPKTGRWRPDFEAPGPHVNIQKKDGISFEVPIDRELDDGDDDDDFTNYRYYESDKVLGKLYRAIDEREIFTQIQQRATNQSFEDQLTQLRADNELHFWALFDILWAAEVGYVPWQLRCRGIRWTGLYLRGKQCPC